MREGEGQPLLGENEPKALDLKRGFPVALLGLHLTLQCPHQTPLLPDAGRDWGQEEKGTTEDEMAGWHHRLDGREFE